MGRHEIEIGVPDTFGLPEFFISEVVTEIDGPNIRIFCGIKRGGRTHWLYSCVMRADLLVLAIREVERAACEAFTLNQLMGNEKGH